MWNLNENDCSDSKEKAPEKVENPENPGNPGNPKNKGNPGKTEEYLESQCKFYKLTSTPLQQGSRFDSKLLKEISRKARLHIPFLMRFPFGRNGRKSVGKYIFISLFYKVCRLRRTSETIQLHPSKILC